MSLNTSRYFEKLLSLLRVRSVVAGMDVSDEILRLAYFDGQAWQMHAIRLSPGVMEQGKIKNRNAFIQSLVELKAASKIGGKDKSSKITVSVSLSSITPYSQVFSLPTISGEDLEKAVELNLAMAAPAEAEQIYSGWQIVGRDENAFRLEILAAFMDKALVNDLVAVLGEAGFIAVAVESRSLALVRVLRKKGAGVDLEKPYLIVSVDNEGFDFLVVRHGQLYFEYADPWREIADAKGEVTIDKFKEELIGNLRRVLNFATQHWPDPVSAVIISASAFQDEIEKTIAGNFSLPAVRMTLEMGQPVSPEWLVALGCSLREIGGKGKERELTLSGEDLENRFHEEQALRFAGFWRIVVPLVFGVLACIFAVADGFFGQTENSVQSSASLNPNAGAASQVAEIEASSTDFNASVALIKSIEDSIDPKGPLISAVQTIAIKNDVTISRLILSNETNPITLSGVAPTEADILALKTSFENDPTFSQINLPLTGIQSNGGNYSFSMTFIYAGQPVGQ